MVCGTLIDVSPIRETVFSRPQRTLHEYNVDPFIELESRGDLRARMREAHASMQSNGAEIVIAGDYSDHLSPWTLLAPFYEGGEQGLSQAFSGLVLREVDGIFNRVPVCDPGAILRG